MATQRWSSALRAVAEAVWLDADADCVDFADWADLNQRARSVTDLGRGLYRSRDE